MGAESTEDRRPPFLVDQTAGAVVLRRKICRRVPNCCGGAKTAQAFESKRENAIGDRFLHVSRLHPHERTRRELDQARDRAAAAEAAAAQAQQSLQAETRRNERLEGRCEGLEAELAQARERIEAARSDERERQGVLLAELKAAHQAHVAELASKHLEAEQALQVQLRQVTDAAVATQRKLQQRIDRLERARTPDTE